MTTNTYEIKAAGDRLQGEVAALDQAVAAAGSQADPLLNEQVNKLCVEVGRLEKELKGLYAAQRRPHQASGEGVVVEQSEHRVAFRDQYLRKGLESGLAGLEAKSLNSTTPGEGGYAVPTELDSRVEARLKDISPIRGIATVVRVGSARYRKLIATSAVVSGWAAETGARAESATPTFAEIAPSMGELFANPAATQAMLDDAVFDVERWLAEETAQEFAKQEGAAFVAGNGTNKPKGFLSYTTAVTGDGVRAFGSLQYVPTGVAGGFAASNPADVLVDLAHSLRPAYRQNAAWVMSSSTLSRIRKFKDADGGFLWQPGLGEGRPATLLGYPVVEAEDMPAIAADALAIAFGDFGRGYVIAERGGARVLRDPYSNKPFVHFYVTKTLGGAVADSDAIKLLKFAAS